MSNAISLGSPLSRKTRADIPETAKDTTVAAHVDQQPNTPRTPKTPKSPTSPNTPHKVMGIIAEGGQIVDSEGNHVGNLVLQSDESGQSPDNLTGKLITSTVVTPSQAKEHNRGGHDVVPKGGSSTNSPESASKSETAQEVLGKATTAYQIWNAYQMPITQGLTFAGKLYSGSSPDKENESKPSSEPREQNMDWNVLGKAASAYNTIRGTPVLQEYGLAERFAKPKEVKASSSEVDTTKGREDSSDGDHSTPNPVQQSCNMPGSETPTKGKAMEDPFTENPPKPTDKAGDGTQRALKDPSPNPSPTKSAKSTRHETQPMAGHADPTNAQFRLDDEEDVMEEETGTAGNKVGTGNVSQQSPAMPIVESNLNKDEASDKTAAKNANNGTDGTANDAGNDTRASVNDLQPRGKADIEDAKNNFGQGGTDVQHNTKSDMEEAKPTPESTEVEPEPTGNTPHLVHPEEPARDSTQDAEAQHEVFKDANESQPEETVIDTSEDIVTKDVDGEQETSKPEEGNEKDHSTDQSFAEEETLPENGEPRQTGTRDAENDDEAASEHIHTADKGPESRESPDSERTKTNFTGTPHDNGQIEGAEAGPDVDGRKDNMPETKDVEEEKQRDEQVMNDRQGLNKGKGEDGPDATNKKDGEYKASQKDLPRDWRAKTKAEPRAANQDVPDKGAKFPPEPVDNVPRRADGVKQPETKKNDRIYNAVSTPGSKAHSNKGADGVPMSTESSAGQTKSTSGAELTDAARPKQERMDDQYKTPGVDNVDEAAVHTQWGKTRREEPKPGDERLAREISATVDQSIKDMDPVLKKITERVVEAEKTPKNKRDEKRLVREVQPLIEQGSKILNSTNAKIRKADPDGRIQKNANSTVGAGVATDAEEFLANQLKTLSGSVTSTIDNAKQKLEDMPDAKKMLQPMWASLLEPLVQIVAAVGLLLTGVLGIVGRLLKTLGLGPIVDKVTGMLRIPDLAGGLGLNFMSS